MSETLSSGASHETDDDQQKCRQYDAEQTIINPEVLARYDKFCWDYSGSKYVGERNIGNHPWQARETREGHREYSVHVFTGYDPETADLIYIGKDDWKHPSDPTSFLVTRMNLYDGEVTEYFPVRSGVDAANNGFVQIAKASDIHNWAPGQHPAYHQEPHEQTRINFRVDEYFHATSATIRSGTYGERVAFEDIDVLHDMRRRLLAERFNERLPELERDFEPTIAHLAQRVVERALHTEVVDNSQAA